MVSLVDGMFSPVTVNLPMVVITCVKYFVLWGPHPTHWGNDGVDYT